MSSGRQPWIPQQLRDYGLTVVEHGGWDTRGSTGFDPSGVLIHHTGGPQGSPAPSLGICINGRGGPNPVPGPLCHILIGRDCVCHVIAAGRANHAGVGGPLLGIPKDQGNQYLLGIEEENDGTGQETRTPEQLQTLTLTAAALMNHLNAPEELCLGHKEWTTRKPDPVNLDMSTFRAAVTAARAAHNQGAPAMPSIDDYGSAMRDLDEFYLLIRGTLPTPEERAVWGENLLGSLTRSEPLTPTFEYIVWALRGEKAK